MLGQQPIDSSIEQMIKQFLDFKKKKKIKLMIDRLFGQIYLNFVNQIGNKMMTNHQCVSF